MIDTNIDFKAIISHQLSVSIKYCDAVPVVEEET
jgi:hypothetical protein